MSWNLERAYYAETNITWSKGELRFSTDKTLHFSSLENHSQQDSIGVEWNSISDRTIQVDLKQKQDLLHLIKYMQSPLSSRNPWTIPTTRSQFELRQNNNANIMGICNGKEDIGVMKTNEWRTTCGFVFTFVLAHSLVI